MIRAIDERDAHRKRAQGTRGTGTAEAAAEDDDVRQGR